MPAHPIRLTVDDDLRRSRLTVFFRLLLALPHYVWILLWSIGVFFVTIVNWFATLALGRSPTWAHNFVAAYVRYSTHLYAYLYLAANPYPGFVGEPGSYPVDAEIDPPEPQRRLVTLFRIVLVLPALLLVSIILGGGPSGGQSGRGEGGGDAEMWGAAVGGVAVAVAVFAWFASLVRGRMPSGFRDLIAWALRYGAQTYGYLLLLTDRYPSSNPFEPRGVPPDKPLAVMLALRDDGRRSRLTVFFRPFLALPHIVWAALWGIAAWLAAIAQWFFALVAGRPAEPLRRFIAAWVRYDAQVYSYLLLAANPFPAFGPNPSYTYAVEIEPPGRQRRVVTFFRLLLALPALVVTNGLLLSAFVAAILGWFAALALGRMPEGLRNLVAFAVHYSAQVNAYLLLVTGRYPYSGPRGSTEEPEEEPFEPEPVAA
jgi:hypothetical protein